MKFFKTAAVCGAAILLNVIVSQISLALSLPLFLDTIFTVAVVFALGLFPGLCVSVGYNLLNYVSWIFKIGGNWIFLYTVCGILITVSTWFFARRKSDFAVSATVTALYLVLIALVSSFFTVLSSGLIDYFLYTHCGIIDKMNPIKKFTESFVSQKYNLLASCILAQIPVSFLDRLISTFAGYGVFRLFQKMTKGSFYA